MQTERRLARIAMATESLRAFPDGNARPAKAKEKFARIAEKLYKLFYAKLAVTLELSSFYFATSANGQGRTG